MKKFLVVSASSCLIMLVIGWALKLWPPSNEKIYPALPIHSFYSFTLTRSDARIPCLQAEIEGIPFLAKLDMGYDGVLSLPKHLLEQLAHKSGAGTVLLANMQGKKYENPVFILPKLNIGDLVFADLPAEESNLEFERDISLGTNSDLEPSEVIARIGWQAFLGAVVLIDLRNSIAICCDSLETLKEKGYPLEQFTSTDLLSGQEFMAFEAQIDDRIVKCLLDTGCTLNLIHAPSTTSGTVGNELKLGSVDFANPLPPAILSIAGHPLRPCVFRKAQIPFGSEAILGIDFLETQVICIDLVNNKLLLCPTSKSDSSDPHTTLSLTISSLNGKNGQHGRNGQDGEHGENGGNSYWDNGGNGGNGGNAD